MNRNVLPELVRFLLCWVALGTFTSGNCTAAESEPTAADIEFFESRIRPVLIEKCYRCHSQEAVAKNQLKGNLLVDSRDGLLRGGDSGSAIDSDDPGSSLLLESLRYESYEMPPEGRLPEKVIADFERWIDRGAADPRTDTTVLPVASIDWESAREHWAYRPLLVPPSTPDTPADSNSRGVTPASPIDAFLLEKLSGAGIEPVREADRVTLARRLSFDLIGLPPTPSQIDAFVSDASPDAYEQFVDRLLGSPRFGERWGRHWLDVARFAESVTLRGLVQHEAWRYRDYVIDSFNRDLPFNEFLRQQIAGDLLDAPTIEERRRQHIATTYLTLTNANLEDQDKEKLRMDVVDEQLIVIGKSMLGQTLGCARCHDHKFDPIPTTDYYALAGILRNTRTLQHSNVSRWLERPLPLTPELEQQVSAREQHIQSLQQQIARLKKKTGSDSARGAVMASSLPGIVIDDEQAKIAGQWKRSTSVGSYVEGGYQHDEGQASIPKQATFETMLPEGGEYEVRLSYSPGKNRGTTVHIDIVAADGVHPTTINQRKKPPIDGLFVSLGRYSFTADTPAKVTISNQDANGHVIIDAVQFLTAEQIAKSTATDELATDSEAPAKQLKERESELKRIEKQGPQRPLYMAVEEESEIGDTHVNVRGNVHSLGPLVPRGFLQVVQTGPAPELPTHESGRRQLGDWLADPTNPLPARVFANRAWHWLFGAGIVSTPDNFGTTGESPSHPELLEYLAGRLIERNWSVKDLVREIVLSQAYRRDSLPQAEPFALDPENRLLWRMNRKRLEAECLLDAVLIVSGDLDHQMGGKTIPEGLSADYDFQHDNRRRAIYWASLRNAIPDLLQVFDGAHPSLVTGRRNVSSVAPQALYLMNNPWVLKQSEMTAKRLLAGSSLSDSARLHEAFRVILGRLPTDEEERTVRAFLTENLPESEEQRVARWEQLVQSLLCSLDFRYLR